MNIFIGLIFGLMSGVVTLPTRFLMEAQPKIQKHCFGKTAEGKSIDIYTLMNKNGVKVKIITYGARVVSLKVPDRSGKLEDVVLGYDDLKSYEQDAFYMGCIVGRFANRIANGRFTLGGATYKLAQNNNGNHLHGGIRGFDKVVWTATGEEVAGGVRLKLTYLSRDMEEGYPGNLAVTVMYTLTNSDELKIQYDATIDKETVVNLTNHAYFNLAGAGNGNVLKHELKINANRFLPTDRTSIPTGELRSVKGTPFDFTQPTSIGARIGDANEQLVFGNGYDHTFVLNKPDGRLAFAIEVYEPTSGRVIQVHTTEPGVQFYSGNFLKDVKGKAGKIYRRRDGFCLEAQHFPDSPNKPAFPSTALKPGERYTQTTVYKFSAR